MLKRILLCGARRSASIPNPFLNIFQVHFPTRQSDAKRSFTLAVVVLLLAVGAAAQSGYPGGCTNGSLCELHWPGTLGAPTGGSGIFEAAFGGGPGGPGVSPAAPGGLGDSAQPPILDLPSGLSSSPNFNLGSDAGPITLVNPYQLPGGGASAIVGRLQPREWTGGVSYAPPSSFGVFVRTEFTLRNLMQGWEEYGPLIAMGGIGPQLPGAGEAPWSETDLVLGLDPGGAARQLKTFQQEVGGGGGKRIVQIWNGKGDVGHVIDQEIRVRALGAPGKIRFNLDGIEGLTDSKGAYGPDAPIWNLAAQQAKYGTATTAWELLGVKVWWRMGMLGYDNVTFYLKGEIVSAPW